MAGLSALAALWVLGVLLGQVLFNAGMADVQARLWIVWPGFLGLGLLALMLATVALPALLAHWGVSGARVAWASVLLALALIAGIGHGGYEKTRWHQQQAAIRFFDGQRMTVVGEVLARTTTPRDTQITLRAVKALPVNDEGQQTHADFLKHTVGPSPQQLAAVLPLTFRIRSNHKGPQWDFPGVGHWVALTGVFQSPRPRVWREGFDEAAYYETHQWQATLTTLTDARVLPTPNVALLTWAYQTIVHRAEDATALFFRALPAPEASFLSGMVFGNQTVPMETALKQAFRTTGTIHLMAASGFNLSVVVGLVWWLTRSVARWRGLRWGLMAMVGLLYAVMAGLAPSIVRAAAMLAMMGLCQLWVPRVKLHQALLLSVAVILAGWPHYAGHLGFQLSVLTTLGLVWMLPPVLALFPASVWKPWVSLVLVSAVAQLWATPLLVVTFHQLSWASIPLNVLLSLLVGPLTLLGFVVVLLRMLIVALGVLLGVGHPLTHWGMSGIAWALHAVQPVLHTVLSGIQWVAQWEGQIQAVPPLPMAWAVVAYALLVGLTLWLNHPVRLTQRKEKGMLPVALWLGLGRSDRAWVFCQPWRWAKVHQAVAGVLLLAMLVAVGLDAASKRLPTLSLLPLGQFGLYAGQPALVVQWPMAVMTAGVPLSHTMLIAPLTASSWGIRDAQQWLTRRGISHLEAVLLYDTPTQGSAATLPQGLRQQRWQAALSEGIRVRHWLVPQYVEVSSTVPQSETLHAGPLTLQWWLGKAQRWRSWAVWLAQPGNNATATAQLKARGFQCVVMMSALPSDAQHCELWVPYYSSVMMPQRTDKLSVQEHTWQVTPIGKLIPQGNLP